MKEFSALEIASAVDGQLHAIAGDTPLSGGVVTDSREVAPGDIYVARRGENFNGIDFAPAAREAGAELIIAEAIPSVDGNLLPSIVVPDATEALGKLAQLNVTALREDGSLTVVAITGSAGKTTVKDLAGDLLSAAGETIWPPNSYNNEVGVPLTALRATANTRFLVLEMGARSIGNLAYLTSLIRPDIGVELNVGSAHSGIFGSIDNTARAKSELVKSLIAGGTAVLNADDPRVAAMADTLADGVDVMWFSPSGITDKSPVVSASDVTSHASGRTHFTLALPGAEPADVELALLGEHHVANALAAAAVAHLCGVEARTIVSTLSTSGAASRWRMELVDNPNGVTVLNDAYNANPESMRAALTTLGALARDRRAVAVLAHMAELGADGEAEHVRIGELAAQTGVQHLIVVGEEAAGIAAGAEGAADGGDWQGESIRVPDAEAAAAALRERMRSGDVVIVKGSRVAALERVIDLITKEDAQ